jgi:hypothetical protein
VFYVNFTNPQDRDYYAREDPIHLEFVRWSADVVDKVVAIDYVDGEFGDHVIG